MAMQAYIKTPFDQPAERDGIGVGCAVESHETSDGKIPHERKRPP
jgi:hypothetical protein